MERATAQSEPFTAIPNDIVEALERATLPPRHWQLVMAILRLTRGWNRDEDRIGSAQLAERTGIDAGNVRRCLVDLQRWGVITRDGAMGRRPTIRLAPAATWQIPGRDARGAARSMLSDGGGASPATRVTHDAPTRVTHDAGGASPATHQPVSPTTHQPASPVTRLQRQKDRKTPLQRQRGGELLDLLRTAWPEFVSRCARAGWPVPPAWDALTSDQQRRVATSAAAFPEPPDVLLRMAVAGWAAGNSLTGAPRSWEYVLRIEPLARAVESRRKFYAAGGARA